MGAPPTDPELWSLPDEFDVARKCPPLSSGPRDSAAAHEQEGLVQLSLTAKSLELHKVNTKDSQSRSVSVRTRSQETSLTNRSQLKVELEAELLRGVSLDVALAGFAKHWAVSCSSSMYQVSHRTYDLSYTVQRVHAFLSHDWHTSRWSKLISLLIMFNLRAATVSTLLASILLGLAIGGDLLPGGFWQILFPYVVFVVVLCTWQRVRSFCSRPTTVFFDKLCIAQHDAELKAAGITGLAAFLDISEQLTILWSPQYFTRLWCTYELATYLRNAQNQKPVRLMPVAMSLMMALMWTVGMMVVVSYEIFLDLQDVTAAADPQGKVPWYNFAPVLLCLSAVAALVVPFACDVGSGMMTDIRNLEQQLRLFCARSTECFCCSHDHKHPETGESLPCDRAMMYTMLKNWYGKDTDVADEHLDRFNTVVRTRVKTVVLQGANNAKLPLRYVLCLAAVVAAPALIDAARDSVRQTREPHEDFWALSWGCIRFVMMNYIILMALAVFYIWLRLAMCRLGARLATCLPRVCIALVLSPLTLVIQGSIWATVTLANASVREIQGDLPLSPLLCGVWLLLSVCLARSCGRWCSAVPQP